MKVPFANTRDVIYLTVIAMLAAAVGVLWTRSPDELTKAPAKVVDAGTRAFQKSLKDTYDSEELLFNLLPRLQKLADGTANLAIPDYKNGKLFAAQVTVRDLANSSAAVDAIDSVGVRSAAWSAVERDETLARERLAIWQPYLNQVRYFEHAKFYFIDARFADETRTRWNAELGFSGLARMRSGASQSIKAVIETEWERAAVIEDDPYGGWQIDRWITGSFATIEAREPVFTEVLDVAIPDPDTRASLRDSQHERMVLRYIADESYAPNKLFRPPAWDRHPGLAVVDIDRDGFDDVYTMARRGKNKFLRNRGDGTFEEIAAELGLDIADYTSSALFADFDNDGDADVFIGRTLQPSQYLMNEGGRFVARSDTHVDGRMPHFVSSISAVDYDGDGLLDIYLATYASQSLGKIKNNLSRFMHREDVLRHDELRMADDFESFVHASGPPNVLLRNVGDGRFVEVMDTPLRVFKNSYQCTWADYDDDGDMDVYCANDFAPDNLLRNEGGGRFVDVTNTAGFDVVGLAMGASWGDYDRDGRLDLYVTNMYSKAGSRIARKIEGLDPRYAQTALGNFLYRNEGDKFRRVSGSAPQAMQVERAGWSWGSQFIDVDNDGDLDIYALNGFYSAPKDVARPGDT